ncbi:hypothetical protein ES705_47841 [subsurface metagenome]
MKKLTIMLIIILLGVFFINALPGPAKSQDQTLGTVVSFLNNTLNKMTSSELATLERKFTQAEFDSATRLLTDWNNLLRISTAAGNIILGR